MTAKSSNERQRALVERRKAEGLKEVRNLWVSPVNEQAVRDYAARLERIEQRRRAKESK